MQTAIDNLIKAIEKLPINSPGMTMARAVVQRMPPNPKPKESQFDYIQYKGKSLMFWAVEWFSMSNDAFYDLHGFNFNPHQWSGLYEAARERVYGSEG
jgi:hypothetical protein